MTKLIRRFALAYFMAILSVLLGACTDSDNLVFDEDNTNAITVDVFMSRSFDSTAARVKYDTITYGDSMLFIANIHPSKSIRIRDSYWLLDDKFYASEFNVHDAISLPGRHEIVFVLITYFGDTLTDTLHLWISSPPILDTEGFIPAAGSQNIPPQEEVQFVWNAYDIDSICSLHYHFVLTNLLDAERGEMDVVDTVIDTPYFGMNRKLKPLSQYRWTVQAFNEYNVPSKSIISSIFTTGGVGDEGAISGTIKMSSENLFAPIDLIVLDKNNESTIITATIEKTPMTGMFEIKPLAPGTYKVTANCKKGPDFVADTVEVKVNAGQVSFIGALRMNDETPPTIQSQSGEEILDFADSLKFVVTDGSVENVVPNTVVYIGNRKVTPRVIEPPMFTVLTIDDDRSWIPQIVTVVATDGSGNISAKSFTLRPSEFWFTTNQDTTISRQSEITVFIKDHNPFSFVPTYFTINPNGDVKGTIVIDANDRTSVEYVLEGSAFHNNEQSVVTTVFYSNGISQSRSWNIKLNEPPFMSYVTSCYAPCESYIGKKAIFRWEPAEDPDDDSLVYRLNVVLGSDTITDSTQFYYRSKFISGNQTILDDLPEGPLYWWVEAKDPYGGISSVWEPKAQAVVLSEEKLERLKAQENNDNQSTPEGEK